MAIFMRARKHGMKLLSMLLTLAMLLSMLPAALAAEGESTLGKVQVIVENTTFTTAVDGVSPKWTKELINTEVELTADSTAMSCVKAALDENDVTYDIDEGTQYGAYIRGIGGLAEKQGGTMSGWMATVNDWFVSESLANITVKDEELEAGDLIRVMYSKDGGTDLGSDYSSTDKRLKSVSFSKGTLNADFAADTHEYTLKLPSDCTGVVVTPTASNKNYQVHTYVGENEYKRTATIPVEDGTVITVKCGDPDWPSMSANNGEAQVYTFTVKVSDEDSILGEGTSGNTTWAMYESGKLVFSAKADTNGTMGSGSSWSNTAWVTQYGDKITSVVINEGVTSIGSYAFAGASKLKTISLPASLTTIGQDAFKGITFDSITVAEGGTFSVKDGFLLKNGGTEIQMVIDTSMLTGVVKIPEGVTTLSNVFKGTEITGVQFPSTLTGMSNYAFSGCNNLKEVTIPCNLTKGYEFNGCKALETITVAEGVTDISYGYAFKGCTALTTVNLPKSLTNFNGTTLCDCTGLKTINVAEGGVYAMKDGMLLKNGTEIVYVFADAVSAELVIPDSITVIGKNAFKGFTNITSLKLPDTLKTIEENAFYGCKGLTTVTIPEGITTLGDYAFADCSALETIKLPSTLESTGNGTFNSCSKLNNVTLPEGLKSVGTSAFGYCKALEEIVVPCDIGGTAFSHCTALKKVTVKEGVTTIGMQAFWACTALESISLPSTITSYDSTWFRDCTALKSITIAEGGDYSITENGLICKGTVLVGNSGISGALVIPEGITELDNNVFKQNTAITSVKLPSTLTKIGNSAFYGCTALTKVEFVEGLESIGSQAFSGCTALETPVFPASLTSLSYSVFYGCTGMKGTITLPGTISSYSNGIFSGCTGLEGAIVEANASGVYGNQLFYGCTGLKSVKLPENITALNSMLYGCSSLKELTIPAGVKTINQQNTTNSQNLLYLDVKGATEISSLYNFAKLEELILPACLEKYSDNAAKCHPSLVLFRGTEEQWNAITFNANTLTNFEKYGTQIVFNYDESAVGEPPVILTQPASVTYEQGLRPNPLTIEVKEEEGTAYTYTWYCGGEIVATGKECAVSTAEVGNFEYYCVVKGVKDGKAATVTSETATVTITEVGSIFTGEGTEESPYLLTSAKDLERLSVMVESGESYSGKFFRMENDIELTKNWVPIGCTKDGTNNINSGKNMNAFSGTFDGNGKLLTIAYGSKPLFAYVYGATIKDLRIYGERINGYGLINNMEGVGLSGTSVIIDNVTIESGTNIVKSGLMGSVITTNGFAGCSAGYAATIKNCTIKKDVVIGCDGDLGLIGSFCGRLQGTIENCVSYATVKGTNFVGGIIGTRDNAMGVCSVKNCTFAGTVVATGKNAGGIVGGGYNGSSAPNGNKISITGCTFSGSVTGGNNVGGILGADEYVAQSWGGYSFTDNTVTGKVSGSENVGAMIGYYKSMNKCDNISGNKYSADCGAKDPIGSIWLIDTSCANPTAFGDTIYVNTESSAASCPSVAGCSWQTGYNRTDDPLGADMEKLFGRAPTSLANGTYGNVNWNVYDNGVLELSAVEGSDGKMGGYIGKWSLPTWTKSYNDKITSIVVKEGVTTILNYAFYSMSNVKSVSFPSTLTSIGEDTFGGVKTLTSFTCAEGCAYKVSDNFLLMNEGTEIYMAIDHSKLTGVVTVPDGVTKIGTTFQGTNITGIVFPSSVKTIEGYTYSYTSEAGVQGGPFAYCTKLESITIPCNLGSQETFVGCTALKEVTFKASVTDLPAKTFDGCTALTSFKFEEGSTFSAKDGLLLKGTEVVFATSAVTTGALTIPEGVTAIGDYVFYKCSGITSVAFPSTLKTIGQYAFAQCKGLTGALALNEGLETIGNAAFGNCSNITSVKLPSTLKSIDKYGFQSTGLTSIEGLRADITLGYYAFASTKITSLNLPDGFVLPTNCFQNCDALTEVSVGSDVSADAFSGCTALKTVTIREGATKVDKNAFKGCTALETVNLPSTLTSLDGTAFSGCTALKNLNFAEGSTYSFKDGILYNGTVLLSIPANLSGDITIADGVTEIGANAFKGMTGITSVKLPESVEKIGSYAFYGCTGLTTINLPEAITKINNDTFSGCTSLKTVNLPSKLVEIGMSAFYNCTALETMPVFPSTLKKIGSSAYSQCTSLKGKVTIPGTVTYLGGSMFSYCSGITSAYIEDCVATEYEEFGTQIFGHCTGLTEVRLPETMTSFSSIIYDCSSLRSLVIPKGVTSLHWQFLPDNFVYLDLGGVTEVESTTLTNMKALKELVLSENLTSYQDKATNCKPDVIYFRGSEEQWNAISFNENTLANLKANGTMIVFNYGSETGDAPTITKQPVGGEFKMGASVTLSIEVEEKEGAQYVYHWYCDGELVAEGKECEIGTGVAGEHEYYCMVRCSVNGKYSEVKSDVVTVTIVETNFKGEGTKENPYLLSTTEDIELLSVKVNAGTNYKGEYFKMTDNIELPKNWKPIGATKNGQSGISKGTNLNAFSGTFDGNGKRVIVPKGERPLFAYIDCATICNLEIYGEQIEGYGLVDCYTGVGMTGVSVIDNITLISGTNTLYSGLIGARTFESGFAGCSATYTLEIKNCTIQSGVTIGYTGDKSLIGGFAGRMIGTIENCVNHGTVKGNNYVGGIIGSRDNSMGTCKVLNCTFDGTVEGKERVGGIAGGGYNDSSAPNGGKVTLIGNTSRGTVKGTSYVGGILGGDMVVAQSWENVASSFKNNTFTGKISGTEYVGALIGYYKSLNKYDDVSGNQYSADCGVDPVGCIWVIDTNCANPTEAAGTTYVNTENGVSGCPTVAGCGWKSGHNRTDDPLGADIANLFSVIGGYKLGDVNNDGEINSMDVMLTNNAVRGKITLTDAQTKAADVNGDGEINSLDVMKINDYVRGKITAFGDAA